MVLDIARLKAETPGADRIAHFNHAGSGLMSAATVAAIQAHASREAEQGGMEAGSAVAAQIEQIRADAAELLGAAPDEIAFTGGNSDGWGRAFAALRLKPGDRVLVGRSEWGGNLACLEQAGLAIETVPADESGQISLAALAGMLDERVRLVSLTWAPANGGLVQPAAAVGRLARAAGVPYFIDAAQAVGQLPADVAALGCDVLTVPGRKYLRGPRGTGLLFVRRDFQDRLDPVFVDTGSAPIGPGGSVLRPDARRFESAEGSMALRLGLGVAIRQTLDLGLDSIRTVISVQAERVRARLGTVPGIQVHDLGIERSGLVGFTFAGRSGAQVQAALAARGITIGFNGRAYTPLDMDARGFGEILRASVGYLTTEAEIDQLVAALGKIDG